MPLPSLDGRSFRDVSPAPAGDVGGDTVFAYHEDADGTVWARYAGGAVRLGFLVGTRRRDGLEFRYAHVTDDGDTATGHCTSRIEQLVDGRLASTRPGRGTARRAVAPASSRRSRRSSYSSSDQC
jgi:hypothetical protein